MKSVAFLGVMIMCVAPTASADFFDSNGVPIHYFGFSHQRWGCVVSQDKCSIGHRLESSIAQELYSIAMYRESKSIR